MSTSKGDSFENITKRILTDFCSSFEISDIEGDPQTKIRLSGRSGAKWQCDLVALRLDDPDIKRVKIECKWKGKKRRVEQDKIAALAWTLEDTGADGIIVINESLQEGAEKIAKAEQIGILKIDLGETEDDFTATLTNWLGTIIVGKGMQELVSTADEWLITSEESSTQE